MDLPVFKTAFNLTGESLLPHRPPFLFVDRLLSADETGALGEYTFTLEKNDFFRGYCPGDAAVPGVILIEAMAQVAGAAIMARKTVGEQAAFAIASIDEVNLRQTFRPEFLNRIDDIIVFRSLTQADIQEVARRMLKTVSDRMESMGIHLDASEEAVAELAREGFDPKYGARPLRRAIQSQVEDAVAEKMLDGTLKAGETARLTVENEKLCVTK